MRRSSAPSLRKREQRLARISLLIVLIFFICHSIKNIPNMFELFGKDPRVRLHIIYVQNLCLLSVRAESIFNCKSSETEHQMQTENYIFLFDCRKFPSVPSSSWLVISSSLSIAVSTSSSTLLATAGWMHKSSSDCLSREEMWVRLLHCLSSNL